VLFIISGNDKGEHRFPNVSAIRAHRILFGGGLT
jgi:hypothetical protein